MRTQIRSLRACALIAAAAITVCGPLALAQDSASENAKKALEQAGKAAKNAGEAVGQTAEKAADKTRKAVGVAGAGEPTASNPAPDIADIDGMMGDLTNAALTKGGMNKVVGYFVDADAHRISDDLDKAAQDDFGAKLDGRIEQIQSAWKTKYGHELDLDEPQQVFTDAYCTVRQAQVGKDASMLLEVMKNSAKAPMNGRENASGNSAGDENLENGRGIAIVDIKASHGAPELRVPLIHQLPDSWKVNVPDSVTGAKLRQNLLNHLTKCGSMSDQWPTSEIEAYRALSHHVLMAVLDKPVE